MEFLNQIWVWIVGAIGGLSITGIITAIIYGVLKGGFSKAIAKIDVDGIADKATDKGVERIKNISFTQSIQPLVESELKKVTEQANEYIENALKQTQENYIKLLKVLEKLSAYFETSVYVSEETKNELKQAIEDAGVEEIETEQEIEIVEPAVVVETPNKKKKTLTR